MPTKDRYQNPVPSDNVILKFFVFNSNFPAEVDTIEKVDIFYLDPAAVTDINPFGKTLVQTIGGGSVANPELGEYAIDLFLDPTIYDNAGRYIDEWHVTFRSGDPTAVIEQLFEVFSDLYYTTPIPVVYDFSFFFQPNRIRQGSKKFIEIEVIPNVPRATDLCRYYENLVISSDIRVFIERNCLDCPQPCETDLRLVVDGEKTHFRERNRAFFKLDTSQLDCGIYDIWFRLDFGTNVYISDKNQLIIYS